ncbi:Uncharacterised protein [Serratia plymuthica]|nr:Uncharacterised protein [Serratia plymuthica]VEI15690.1 Uncharacterised protein [Serratia plymuthica]
MNYYLILLCFFSGIATASQYPIITSIQTIITSSTTATYNGTFTIMDIGEAADIPVPAGWVAGIGHRHDNFPGGADIARMRNYTDSCDSFGCSILTGNNMTIGQAAMSAYRKWGVNSFSINHSGEGNGGECVGFLASATYFSSSWGSVIMPSGSCLYAPPGKDWCNMITPQITLNHGVLRFEDANGHSSSAQLNINCTVGTTVKLRLMNNQTYIDLQNGLRSDIFIEGNPVGGSIKLQAGRNMVSMNDQLSGEISSGAFYGSAVLVMEPV